MTPEELRATLPPALTAELRDLSRAATTYDLRRVAGQAAEAISALLDEVEALTRVLRDLLDDMAEDVSQRHHRDKYRVYQVSPEVVEEARAFLAAREQTT